MLKFLKTSKDGNYNIECLNKNVLQHNSFKGPDHSGARFDSFGAFLADFWGFQIFPFSPPHETTKIKVA